jgi:hypothetical protein
MIRGLKAWNEIITKMHPRRRTSGRIERLNERIRIDEIKIRRL